MWELMEINGKVAKFSSENAAVMAINNVFNPFKYDLGEANEEMLDEILKGLEEKEKAKRLADEK